MTRTRLPLRRRALLGWILQSGPRLLPDLKLSLRSKPPTILQRLDAFLRLQQAARRVAGLAAD